MPDELREVGAAIAQLGIPTARLRRHGGKHPLRQHLAFVVDSEFVAKLPRQHNLVLRGLDFALILLRLEA